MAKVVADILRLSAKLRPPPSRQQRNEFYSLCVTAGDVGLDGRNFGIS